MVGLFGPVVGLFGPVVGSFVGLGVVELPEDLRVELLIVLVAELEVAVGPGGIVVVVELTNFVLVGCMPLVVPVLFLLGEEVVVDGVGVGVGVEVEAEVELEAGSRHAPA